MIYNCIEKVAHIAMAVLEERGVLRGREKSWVEFLMSVNVSNIPAILPMVSNDENSPMVYKCG